MELILVRHGLPEKIVAASGPADPPLDAVGRRQAELLSGYLASEGIAAIYSSPMQRARQTAEPLSAALGLPIVFDDRVAEYDRNSNEYIPIEELKATNHPHWTAMQRGEWVGEGDPRSFQDMVVQAFEEIIERHRRQKVVITCHGGVINAYLDHVLGGHRPTGFFHPDYTSIHRVMAATTGERSIRAVNEIAHLRGTNLLQDRP